MKYVITEEDKALVLQTDLQYKYRLFIVDNNKNILDEIQGVSSIGSYSIDEESNIRRTTSFVLQLDNDYKTKMSVEKKLFSWIGYNFQMQIGIYSFRLNDYKWYDCGHYLITEGNTSYNSIDNSLSLNLSDWYSKLEGTRNGQMGGAPTIEIPNYDANDNPITIKQVTEGILKGETDIVDYIIDDIGEFYGMAQNNPDYVQYRVENPLWNQLPYELKYEAGCTVGDIFEEIKNLYPNCQMYFDIFGNFCFDLIPSCEYDPITLDDNYIQSILVADNAETVDYDINSIKNVTEVFGLTYEPDRYATTCTTLSNLYTLSLQDYNDYFDGDVIAFVPNTNNVDNMTIKINDLNAIPLYYEYTTDYVQANTLIADSTYVFKIRINYQGLYIAYFLGQYQPHALCVLSNNANDTYYTKEYFSQKYNCAQHNITIRIEEDSPFVVQKLGEILDVKTGEEFDNILSDSVAKENAIYYNRQSSSVYDTITISTKMVPFLDVNEKIEYRKQQETLSNYYITKAIDNQMDSCTSQITMYRFYPLYYK